MYAIVPFHQLNKHLGQGTQTEIRKHSSKIADRYPAIDLVRTQLALPYRYDRRHTKSASVLLRRKRGSATSSRDEV